MSREEITVNNANGYSGTLHGKELTVSYHGKVVLHTYHAAPTNEEELNECLRQMPEFLRYQNQRYRITTKDGRTYEAKLIHLNPQYHRKADSLDVWRREGDVPRKQRYIRPKDVESWEAIE